MGGRWSGSPVFAALLLLFRDILRQRCARRVAEREGMVRAEDWGDHLAVHSESGSRFVALETVAQVIAGREHVFLQHNGGPAILPMRAFADAGDMLAYAAMLDGRVREAGI